MTRKEKIEKVVEAFMVVVENMSDEDLELYYQAGEILKELKDYMPSGEAN